MYDFKNLSWLDFEELVRDLIGAELGIRFESFAPGPDGGMDGRHAKGSSCIILQAKHYADSSHSTLKSALRREAQKIHKIKMSRYIIATSQSISKTLKDEILEIFSGIPIEPADIVGLRDLNQMIRSHPNIERANIKLWLGSAAVLDQIMNSASYNFNAMTRDEIELKVRVYASNPSLDRAREKIEENHVLIISGPPGVGKTTLAEMLALAYMSDGWELIAIRSLDDGLASISDAKKQIFFFDDFLGKVALDSRALANKDSDIVKFITRISKSKNARFVLTTRAYILEAARKYSEYIADRRIATSKYVLDVGIYTRRIRAQILYNHLLVAGTPIDHVSELISSNKIAEIVDHKNYNPRIIEWMTDPSRIKSISSHEYTNAFLCSLDNPDDIWDIAFRTHIDDRCRHLLYCQYFLSEYGVELDTLRRAFDTVHPTLSRFYGTSFAPDDFDDALKILEGGFLTIKEKSVQFINPSVRDYMSKITNNKILLTELARSSPMARWSKLIWEILQPISTPEEIQKLIHNFRPIASTFSTTSTEHDLDKADRIYLLLEWWNKSRDQYFANLALETALIPFNSTSPWESRWLVNLIAELKDPIRYADVPDVVDIVAALECDVVAALGYGLSFDELEAFAEEIEQHEASLSDAIREALDDAIATEIKDPDNTLEYLDSEAEIEDYMRTIEKLAPRSRISGYHLSRALEAATDRITALEYEIRPENGPTFFGNRKDNVDSFDDAALRALFDPLTLESR